MRTKIVLMLLVVMGLITVCCKNTKSVNEEITEVIDTTVVDSVKVVEMVDSTFVVE